MMISHSVDYLESGLWLVLRSLFGTPMLLSIAGGTVCYMLLVQLVF